MFDTKKFEEECRNARAEVFLSDLGTLPKETTPFDSTEPILTAIHSLNSILLKQSDVLHLEEETVHALNESIAELSKVLVESLKAPRFVMNL